MDTPAPLRELTDALAAARADGDGAAIARLYATDGLIILPDQRRLAGREAIAAYYLGLAVRKARELPRLGVTKYFFFPPIVHAITTANGRHGEKHSFIDILTQQEDGAYLVAFSSWTLR